MDTWGVVAARGQGKRQVCFARGAAGGTQGRSREKSSSRRLWKPGVSEWVWGGARKSEPPVAHKELQEQIGILDSDIGINASTEG